MTYSPPSRGAEGGPSALPFPSSLNLATFLRGNLENWAKGFPPSPPFDFVLLITWRGGVDSEDGKDARVNFASERV